MRMILTALGIVVLVVVGGGLTLRVAGPSIAESLFHLNCGDDTDTSESCRNRIRAIGHLYADRKRMDDAYFWYALGAQRDDPKAMFHLAWLYEQRAHEETLARIRHLAEVAAGAARRIDEPLSNDNAEQAKRWYKTSAEMGFAPSMNNLGQIYFAGLGGRQDFRRSFEWSLAAAEAGNPVASLNVAHAYASGRGVDADPRKAAKWRAWTAPDTHLPDLDEPTLSRTRLLGQPLDKRTRDGLRAIADGGGMMKMEERAVTATVDGSFADVQRKLLESQRTVEHYPQ